MDETVAEGVDWALRVSAPEDEPVARALEGGLFPLTRAELVEVAKENDAPRVLITLLNGIPDTLYANLKEVQEAVA